MSEYPSPQAVRRSYTGPKHRVSTWRWVFADPDRALDLFIGLGVVGLLTYFALEVTVCIQVVQNHGAWAQIYAPGACT